MNQLLAIPIEIRMAVIFAVGVCLGSLANLGIYRLAYRRRSISPWSQADKETPPRCWTDRLPIVGWLGLRREASLHGRGFWIRPMLVELLTGVGMAALYWWEIGQLGLLPEVVRDLVPKFAPQWLGLFHQHFVAHAILVWLMIVASLIDVDEKTIPDAVTTPGTLIALLLATVWPHSSLPDVILQAGNVPILTYLTLASPQEWPAGLGGFPETRSLVIGLACWWAWCVALMPRTWYSRHGLQRACGLCWARLVRERVTYRLLWLGLIGSALIAGVWFHGGTALEGLLSALVGMVGGGGVVWLVRIVGTVALRREAMGFGDVTLMAMIGALLGWQTCLIIFFLAPFAALLIGIVQLIVLRDSEIPYGPFLCMATLFVIVRWADVWGETAHVFALGWFVPAVVLACMGLMGLMLGAWQWVKSQF